MGDDAIKKLFADPLTLIDFQVDLDQVLDAASIGDAMLLLCPSLDGNK